MEHHIGYLNAMSFHPALPYSLIKICPVIEGVSEGPDIDIKLAESGGITVELAGDVDDAARHFFKALEQFLGKEVIDRALKDRIATLESQLEGLRAELGQCHRIIKEGANTIEDAACVYDIPAPTKEKE